MSRKPQGPMEVFIVDLAGQSLVGCLIDVSNRLIQLRLSRYRAEGHASWRKLIGVTRLDNYTDIVCTLH